MDEVKLLPCLTKAIEEFFIARGFDLDEDSTLGSADPTVFDAPDLANAILAALTRPPIGTDEVVELKEWAFEKSRVHHQLAHDNEHLRTEHIASSAAYRELALEIEARLKAIAAMPAIDQDGGVNS